VIKAISYFAVVVAYAFMDGILEFETEPKE
jgi:hypothetical protein